MSASFPPHLQGGVILGTCHVKFGACHVKQSLQSADQTLNKKHTACHWLFGLCMSMLTVLLICSPSCTSLGMTTVDIKKLVAGMKHGGKQGSMIRVAWLGFPVRVVQVMSSL